MLQLYDEFSGLERKDVYNADKIIVRSYMEDDHANMQETCGEFTIFI